MQVISFDVYYSHIWDMATQSEKFHNALGVRLQSLRMERGLSILQLSEISNVGKSQLYRIEAGGTNCTMLVLLGIANALEVSPSNLLDFEV